MNTNQLNLSSSLSQRWLPLVGLGIAALGLIVSGAMIVTGVSLEDAWQPLGLMGGIGAFVALLMGIGLAVSVSVEERRIRGLLESPWASWRLYADEEAWRAAREEKHNKEHQAISRPIVSAIMLGVVGGFIFGFLTFYYFPANSQYLQPGDTTRVEMIVGAMLILMVVLVFVAYAVRRNQAERRHEWRMAIAMPTVYFGRSGFYRDDEGYRSLRGLKSVALEGGELRAQVYETFRSGQHYTTMLVTLAVPVPEASRSDAEQVAQRLRREVLREE